jgi:hypothetical protein
VTVVTAVGADVEEDGAEDEVDMTVVAVAEITVGEGGEAG